MTTKKSDAQFLSECKQIEETRGIILVEGQSYQGTHHYYTWKCAHDGHIWEAPWVRIMGGKGCPLCGAKRTGMKKSLGVNEFMQRMEERNQLYSPITYVSGFTNSTSKCTFKCDTCDHQWDTVPKSLFRGVGCPQCGLAKRSVNRVRVVKPPKVTAPKRDDNTFQDECAVLAKERGIILVEGQVYAGVHHYYTWKCAHDGHVWEAPFARINQDKGCPECGAKRAGNKNSVTEDDFKQRLDERNTKYTPTISYIGGYVASTKKCMFKCDECGNEWITLPRTVCDGIGCPECAKKKNATSHTYTLTDVKRLIDQRNDKLQYKRVYIVENSFVSYGQPVEFTCDHGHNWITKLDHVINGEAGCPHCAGSIQRDAEDAVAEIKDKHPLIKIISPLGDTLGRREEIGVECEHGHRWTATYERLVINGNYCPHCANRVKLTQDQFVSVVADNNPNVTVIGEYLGMNDKVTTQCNECNHIWNPIAAQIRNGSGCPMCARNNTYSKKSIEWLTEIETQQGIKIDHAVSGGEFRVPGTRYRVDGYHKESNTIYEFHGNYWHGNPKKHNPDEYNTTTECTFGELYERTLKKEAEIRSLGYNLVVMWEYDYDQQSTVAKSPLTAV